MKKLKIIGLLACLFCLFSALFSQGVIRADTELPPYKQKLTDSNSALDNLQLKMTSLEAASLKYKAREQSWQTERTQSASRQAMILQQYEARTNILKQNLNAFTESCKADIKSLKAKLFLIQTLLWLVSAVAGILAGILIKKILIPI